MYFETTGLNTPELAPSFYTAMEDPEDLNKSQQQSAPLDVPSQLFEDDTEYYANADHVVFVIHGIGQQTEQYGMFHTHMNALRDTMKEVLSSRMPQEDIRIKMVPIEWHRHIHSQTDHHVNRIMPKTIPTIRLIESDYLSDVMYYFTKERGQSIINHVTSLFNQSYRDFMEQQPNFNGKVAILGYSLGGLISWDILSHQRQNLTAQEMEQLGKYDVKVPKLDFQPDYLFGMGCPMAGLLIARNQDPRYYHPDYRTVYENIYHPMDPLAFRLEPLLNQDFEEPAVAIERAIPQQPSSFASLVFSLFRGSSSSTTATTSTKEQNQTGAVATTATVAATAAAQQGGILSSLFGYFYYSSSQTDNAQQDQEQQPQRRASEGDILRIKKQQQPEAMTKPLLQQPQQQQRQRSNTMPSLNTGAAALTKMSAAANCPGEEQDDIIMPTPSLSATPTSSCPTTAPQTPISEHDMTPLLSSSASSSCWNANEEEFCDIEFSSSAIEEEEEEEEVKQPPLPLGRRYDFELTPENFMGMISNEYILGLRAHFSYWNNKDMLWHIFRRMEDIEN